MTATRVRRPLLLLRMAASPQLDDQRVLVKLLIQTRLQFDQDRHPRADDVFGCFFVEHGND